jgi:hypothetical protein
MEQTTRAEEPAPPLATVATPEAADNTAAANSEQEQQHSDADTGEGQSYSPRAKESGGQASSRIRASSAADAAAAPPVLC